jgi:hypothetical protein
MRPEEGLHAVPANGSMHTCETPLSEVQDRVVQIWCKSLPLEQFSAHVHELRDRRFRDKLDVARLINQLASMPGGEVHSMLHESTVHGRAQ